MLGNHLQQTGFWDHAVEYYLKGLEIDDLEEELYQNLMICYQKLGHQAKAIEIYQRCQTTMLSILGIEPSSKTRNIYNSISPAQMKAQ
jgi:DNA-binding SARP family transcriptional activator